MALLHSFWQAALLLLVYSTINKLIQRNNAPLAKRNFLYSALAAQLILFAFTFSIYFFEFAQPGNFAAIIKTITGYLGNDKVQSVTPWIFSLYLFVIGYKLIKAIFSWHLFKQQYKTGLQKPPVELKLFTELKAYQFGIKRKVKLWLSTSINTPVTFGFFKPVILLPVALLNNISTQQAETLILHELTHIHTNDYLLNWFLITSETIFFFNPFVSLICKKIRLEREKNCDVQVISFEYAPSLYAETLLQAEKMKQLVPDFQLAAVNRKKHLLLRIQYFSDDKILNQPLRFNFVAVLAGLILFFLLSSAIIFNSSNSSAPLNTSASMPFIPFSNYLVSDIDFGKNILPEKKEAAFFVEKTELIKPGNENVVKKAVPAPEKINLNADKPAEQFFVMPVTIQENDASKQIIIREESSGTRSSTVKVYQLSFNNGQWILQPELILTAQEIILDSLSRKFDTTNFILRKILPAQQ